MAIPFVYNVRNVLQRPVSTITTAIGIGLTVAVLLAAMARGVRLGWIDTSYRPVVMRAWRALSAHITEDGSLVDVCTGTGAGPTLRYYLNRPAIDGPDDRGGAMALLASIEVSELGRRRAQ
ncbi:MAG: glycoside hydrolase family 88 protein [Gemmatimonadaceae bacterium]